MPATAENIAAYLGEDTEMMDLRNPELNIRYGVWHLGRLMGKYSDSVVTALAAYNAGEDNAERWLASAGATDGFVYMESVSFRETREYTRKVLADLHAYSQLYKH
jgi:soluble lytic murein transglycosylase